MQRVEFNSSYKCYSFLSGIQVIYNCGDKPKLEPKAHKSKTKNKNKKISAKLQRPTGLKDTISRNKVVELAKKSTAQYLIMCCKQNRNSFPTFETATQHSSKLRCTIWTYIYLYVCVCVCLRKIDNQARQRRGSIVMRNIIS